MNEESLFAAALEKSTTAERQAFLDEACGGDVALRQRVDNLLTSDEHARGILERGPDGMALPIAEPASPLAADRMFAGRFKLRQRLGAGGMGEVWVADQLEPVQRRVALKVIRPGHDSARMLARFDQERQALALMDHPNIAKVLDAGVTDGRPYFVMEFIEGVSITHFCDEARLSPHARLELFIPVCHAVQHAHQKGIIHRDLKPSNVLVALYDGKPVPKVIDFGVAKATGPRLTDQSIFTEVGSLIGTLEYMSPEQAELNNFDIDTRSDVYALGVVLYELLTGSVPFPRKELQSAAFVEMLRIIKEVDPPKPSTRLSGSGTLPNVAAVRHMEPMKLIALIRGELDWIVVKCLEKDRARRYESSSGLALDLQRYLADEPVVAGPPSAGYRIRKLIRRNRGLVLAASLLLVALAGGVVGTTIGLVRAERARQAVVKLALGERQAKESAQKRLAQIEKGIGILGSVFENLDPKAEETEGRPLRAILGDRLDQAAAGLEGDAVGDPLLVARLQDRLGRTYLGLGHAAKAEAIFTRSLTTRHDLLGADDPVTFDSQHNLALAYEAVGKRDLAIKLLEQVRAGRANVLGADHLDTLASLNSLAVEYWHAGKPTQAIPLLEQVRDGRVKQLGENHDHTLTTLQVLAGAYHSAGKRTEAIALAEQVWDVSVKKHGDDHPKAIAAMGTLAYIYQGNYKMKQALALFEQARDKVVPKLGRYHPMTLEVLKQLGHMYRVFRRTPEAIALLEQVREREFMVIGVYHPNTLITLWELAGAYLDAGELDKALLLFQQAAAGVEKLDFAHAQADVILKALARCHELLKQYDQAEAWRRKVLPLIKVKYGPESADYADTLARLGTNLLQQTKPDVAEPILRESLNILRKQRQEMPEAFQAQSLLGAALTGLQKYADAEPLLLDAYQGMTKLETDPRHKRPGPPSLVRHVETLERLVQLYEAWDKKDEAAKWRKELNEAKAHTNQP